MLSKLFHCLKLGILFIIIFLGIHFAHARFFPVNVVFYSALYDAAIALIMIGIVMYIWRVLSGFEYFLLSLIFILGAYAFAISIPTVIDRSLSIYILEKLDQRGGAIRQDAFEYIFQNEYMTEHRLVNVRLTEQLESGTIMIQNDCVLLTPRGKQIAYYTRMYRQHLLPKQRQLMGEMTDALTDPFKDSKTNVDYACEKNR